MAHPHDAEGPWYSPLSSHHYLTPADAVWPPFAGLPGTPLQLPRTGDFNTVLTSKTIKELKLLKQKQQKRSYLNECTTKGNQSVKATNKKECYMKLKTFVQLFMFVYEYCVKKPDISNKIYDLPPLLF